MLRSMARGFRATRWLVALVAAGCGEWVVTSDVPPEATGQFMQGIWRGAVTGYGLDVSVVGMVDENGHANLICDWFLGGDQLSGWIRSIDADAGNSNLTLYSWNGSFGYERIGLFPFQSGSVSAGATLTATLVLANAERFGDGYGDSFPGDTFYLELQYDSLYERPASLALIAGEWRSGDTAWHIDGAGALTGLGPDGCAYEGQLTIPNAAHNLYHMEYWISGQDCDPYHIRVEGQAMLDDTLVPNDTLRSACVGTVGWLPDSVVRTLTRQ